MDCLRIEERLSEYLESSLPAEDMKQVHQHLQTCTRCSELLKEMQSVVALCRGFPTLDLPSEVVDRILLRTSGRPSRRSFREKLQQHLLRPLWTPRFAAGTALAVLFFILLVNFVTPRVTAALSAVSLSEFLALMDRGAQYVYGQGLKAYDKKNEWEAQAAYFKNNVVNKLRFIIGRIEVPMEGNKKSQERGPGKEGLTPEKSRGELFPASDFEVDCS